MSTTKPTDSPVKSPTGTGAESPTTVRPLDMDDDDVQETVALSGDAPNSASAPKAGGNEEVAPQKPPRPLNPQQQAENTLKEAFPTIDAAVVKAVLIASGGKVEPAFNALLGMSDPDAAVDVEPVPPPQPPRPTAPRMGSTPMSQMEADEMYARQLAEHYGGAASMGQERTRSSAERGRRKDTGLNPNELYDDGHSFLDDDLPVIKENLRKGFVETQKTVNSWITNLKKRIDGDDLDDIQASEAAQSRTGAPANQSYGSRRSGDGRRSGDYNRYDADPQVLGDDFAGIQLNEDGSQARRSTRPLANPDLFKPTPKPPRSSDGRKVAFQNGPPEDIDLYRTSPKPQAATPSGKQSKWQPLSAVDPSPVGENENDPFSLGDSEDEKESKDRVGGKEIRMEDSERLKQAAAEASPASPARKPEPAETSGTKDKLAAETLGGES